MTKVSAVIIALTSIQAVLAAVEPSSGCGDGGDSCEAPDDLSSGAFLQTNRRSSTWEPDAGFPDQPAEAGPSMIASDLSGLSLDLQQRENHGAHNTGKFRGVPAGTLVLRRGQAFTLRLNTGGLDAGRVKQYLESARRDGKDFGLVAELAMSGAQCADTPAWDDGDPSGPYTCADYRDYNWCQDATTECGTAGGWRPQWHGTPESWGALDNCCESCSCGGRGSGQALADWGTPVLGSGEPITLSADLPACSAIDVCDAAIGRFVVKLTFGGFAIGSAIDMFVLYNPYQEYDPTYLGSAPDREEYVENEESLIWVGSSASSNFPKLWKLLQFDFANLEVSMKVLRSLGYDQLKDPVLVTRQLSFAVNRDLCWGKWGSESYQQAPKGGYGCDTGDCHSPGYWSNTTELFEVYKKYNKQVQYCQCFVYAGITTSIARALGLPSRIVSNFQSAHDYGANRAVEFFVKYYPERNMIAKTDPPEHSVGPDSVWNFHVWNEVRFHRGRGMGGWQVVDSTPQERSAGGNPACDDPRGCYALGPAPISMIRSNADASYDSEFVLTEVNAAINLWYNTDRSPQFRFAFSSMGHPWGRHQTVGQQVSTKRPGPISAVCRDWATARTCGSDYLADITDSYKRREPSGPFPDTDHPAIVQPGALWDPAQGGAASQIELDSAIDNVTRFFAGLSGPHDVAVSLELGGRGDLLLACAEHPELSVLSVELRYNNTAAAARVLNCSVELYADDAMPHFDETGDHVLPHESHAHYVPWTRRAELQLAPHSTNAHTWNVTFEDYSRFSGQDELVVDLECATLDANGEDLNSPILITERQLICVPEKKISDSEFECTSGFTWRSD